MDVKDLMIGDLVTFKDCQNDENLMPIEIVALGYQQGGGRESSLVSINGDKACDIFDIDDEIVGIPLTAEILEKNGFIRDGESWWYKDFRVVLFISNGVSLVCGRQMRFRYVHELQHALKLCGIEKEIQL